MANEPAPSMAKRRIGAVLLLLAAGAVAYMFLYDPLIESARTHVLHYSIKAILLVPSLVCVALVLAFTRITDADFRTLNAKGNPTFTRLGWKLMAIWLVIVVATFVAWHLLLRSLGFSPF